MPAVDLTRPCTKWSYQIKSVEEVRSVVHEAYRVALTGKQGPVHLDLPKDVMTSLLKGASLPLPMSPPPTPIDGRALERVVQLLTTAKKPILYVGQGANNAPDELLAVAEAIGCPLLRQCTLWVSSLSITRSRCTCWACMAPPANFAIQSPTSLSR